MNCLCLSEETKSWWSLLSGVYARGSKRSHTGGKCVTCSGLILILEKDNSENQARQYTSHKHVANIER